MGHSSAFFSKSIKVLMSWNAQNTAVHPFTTAKSAYRFIQCCKLLFLSTYAYTRTRLKKFRLCVHRSDHTSPESGMEGAGHQREWRGVGAQYYLFKNATNLHIHAGWYHTSEINVKLESTRRRLMLGTAKFQSEILIDKFTQATLNDISGKGTVDRLTPLITKDTFSSN